MNIIIDTNIFVSAILKDSMTRKILINAQENFLFPEYILEELRKHRNLFLKKSGLNENDYDLLIHTLLEYVTLVSDEAIETQLDESRKLIEHIDPKDVVFVACGLVFLDSVIWSNDTDLKKQKRIGVLNTKEIIEVLGIA